MSHFGMLSRLDSLYIWLHGGEFKARGHHIDVSPVEWNTMVAAAQYLTQPYGRLSSTVLPRHEWVLCMVEVDLLCAEIRRRGREMEMGDKSSHSCLGFRHQWKLYGFLNCQIQCVTETWHVWPLKNVNSTNNIGSIVSCDCWQVLTCHIPVG